MKVLFYGGRAICEEKDAKIPDKRVSGGCLAAEIGHHAPDDQI